jgi:hypothetical protein
VLGGGCSRERLLLFGPEVEKDPPNIPSLNRGYMIVQQVGMIFPLGKRTTVGRLVQGRDELAFPRTGEKAPMVSGLHERHL